MDINVVNLTTMYVLIILRSSIYLGMFWLTNIRIIAFITVKNLLNVVLTIFQ